MESSQTLLSASIKFLDTQLVLVHIPLHLYSNFLQPILQLLLPTAICDAGDGAVQAPEGFTPRQPFINISVTPIECSIVCSRKLVNELFVPILDLLDTASKGDVVITDDFIVMSVEGDDLDADRRVLEFTGPLALAGISIFFITSYFSDYILVPSRHRKQVVQALEDKGLRFEDESSSYINPNHHGRKTSIPTFEVQPPSTPPPATVSELQVRTFATLKRRNIVPTVDPKIRLISCAGRLDSQSRNTDGSTNPAEDSLHLGLVKCLISAPHPKFLSLTLTGDAPASLLIDHTLLPNFQHDALMGSRHDHLIPITLDLRDLPVESTGIVCGVAGRVVGETSEGFQEPVEMSYLSTARAGTVMVPEEHLHRALDALRGTENGVLSTPD